MLHSCPCTSITLALSFCNAMPRVARSSDGMYRLLASPSLHAWAWPTHLVGLRPGMPGSAITLCTYRGLYIVGGVGGKTQPGIVCSTGF